jgi:hypothetical protein
LLEREREMTVDTTGPRRFRWVHTLGILLGIALAILLVGSSRANAAACADLEACGTAADWEKAISDDYSNKAAWFRATSAQNFVNAKQWGDKATFAFHAGDATAATWYKAIADDYARKAVADSKAATNYANQSLFWAAAADRDYRRYAFIANAPEGAEPGAPFGTAASSGGAISWGTRSLSKARVICKRSWQGWLACTAVKAVITGEAKRFIWKLNGGDCYRRETRYDVNPSTGYVNRVYEVCTRWHR